MPANAKLAASLKDAAQLALGRTVDGGNVTTPKTARGAAIRGLYAGGTLCAEAQHVLLSAGAAVSSNVAIPGASGMAAPMSGHVLIDLGDDEYTQGRPHPMIEPAVRDGALADAVR